MTQWQLLCLGPPELWQGNQLVALRTRKALALLILLAVEGRVFSREELTAFLWPNSDEARGRSMLRNTLSYCRQAFGDTNGRILETTPQSVNLAGNAGLSVDTKLLQTAYSAITQPPSDQATLLSLLETAISHYRGDFLSGFSLPQTATFDDWARQQREMWHYRFSQILNTLSRLQLESGHHSQAIATLQRWLTLNPLDETAYRRLMQAYAISGNLTNAHQTYLTCRQQLATELGVEPSPETKALYSQISSHHPSIAPSLPRPSTPASLSIPFVGRTAEHTRLVAAYHVIQQRQPQLVIISGEAALAKPG